MAIPRPTRSTVSAQSNGSRLTTDEIDRLSEMLRALQSKVARLEERRAALLRENRALRQEVTRHRLVDDLVSETAEGNVDSDESLPPARRLYDQLPDRSSFGQFFQLAEAMGLDTEMARRCLLHLLRTRRLIPSGASLRKAEPDEGEEAPVDAHSDEARELNYDKS